MDADVKGFFSGDDEGVVVPERLANGRPKTALDVVVVGLVAPLVFSGVATPEFFLSAGDDEDKGLLKSFGRTIELIHTCQASVGLPRQITLHYSQEGFKRLCDSAACANRTKFTILFALGPSVPSSRSFFLALLTFANALSDNSLTCLSSTGIYLCTQYSTIIDPPYLTFIQSFHRPSHLTFIQLIL